MAISFFFKKKKQRLFEGFIDIHNHILPRIDDGSKSVDQSLEMMNIYADLGIQKLITTPHIYKDLYPNTKHNIQIAYTKLHEASKNHSVELIDYAAEYMVDEFFINEINTKTVLLTCFDNYVLIEIPFFGDLKRLNEALFKLLNMGYLPILAHPERYSALHSTKEVEDLKQKGALMQLNALSLIGFYGREVQKKASLWLQKGLYDVIGTDAHNAYQLTKLKEIHLSKKEYSAWDQICEKQVTLINN
jgi:protein-tyrosine phosphatase